MATLRPTGTRALPGRQTPGIFLGWPNILGLAPLSATAGPQVALRDVPAPQENATVASYDKLPSSSRATL